MKDSKYRCFVCNQEIDSKTVQSNTSVNLPVCSSCKDTEKEKEAEEEFLDSLADGLVCGCI